MLSLNRSPIAIFLLVSTALIAILVAIYLYRTQIAEKQIGLQREELFEEDRFATDQSRQVETGESGISSDSVLNILEGRVMDSSDMPTELLINWQFYSDPTKNQSNQITSKLTRAEVTQMIQTSSGYQVKVTDSLFQQYIDQVFLGDGTLNGYVDSAVASSNPGYLKISLGLGSNIRRALGYKQMDIYLVKDIGINLKVSEVVIDGYKYELVPGGYFAQMVDSIVLGTNRSLQSLTIQIDGREYVVTNAQFLQDEIEFTLEGKRD